MLLVMDFVLLASALLIFNYPTKVASLSLSLSLSKLVKIKEQKQEWSFHQFSEHQLTQLHGTVCLILTASPALGPITPIWAYTSVSHIQHRVLIFFPLCLNKTNFEFADVNNVMINHKKI